MLQPLLLAGAALLAGAPVPGEPDPDDEAVRRAWGLLRPDEQEEARQWFTAEAAARESYQNRLIRAVRALVDRDPGTFPEAGEPAFFDPEVHAPKQPIRRRWVEPDGRAWKRLQGRFLAKFPERRLVRAWRYDYGGRQVVRTADDLAPDHVAENALRGFPPDLDFAEALVESLLDDGAQQLALGAFARTYTDRAGQAFRGITLYDAWSSGAEMEMPDVDALGVVHTVLDEWTRWVAPVPGSAHDSLYETIGAIYVDASRHRELRSALARTYALAEPVLPLAYGPHRERFHALWFEAEDDPHELAQLLPTAERSRDFLAEATMRIEKDPALIAARRERLELLAEDQRAVRALWVRILRELGAFDRDRRPRPTTGGDDPQERKGGR